MRRRWFVLLGVVLLLLVIPAAAQARPSFDQAIDRAVARGWPQRVNEHLSFIPGSNPELGMYFGGTRGDDARARYIAKVARQIGLTNVRLEAVPVDTFEFKSASVQVGTRHMIASAFVGISPTPPQGITAPVVWAHEGTAQDFDALHAAGVDVTGKLVIITADPNNWWMNDPQAEATYRGAAGVIFTYGPTTAPYWTWAPDLLVSFDSNADLTDVPAVYISQQDGLWLEGQIGASGVGPVTTMKHIVSVKLAENGGEGYNVVADLPGRSKDGTFVLFGAHHDAFFHSGTDDTSGCTGNLLIAKAMVDSHYRPKHTVRFLWTTAEEYGVANSYYDWCWGSWWANTHAHPKWVGKIRGFLNIDHFTTSDKLIMQGGEFGSLLESEAAGSADLLPLGYQVKVSGNTWNDTWTFEAEGAPVVNFTDKLYGDPRYHSNYMLPYSVDWVYTGGLVKFIQRVQRRINDGGLIPCGLTAGVDAFAATVSAADLTGSGADAAKVSRLQTAIAAVQTAAAAYESRASTIPASHVTAVNKSLLSIWKKYNRGLMAQSPWQVSGYRHEHVLSNAQSLNDAIAALQLAVPDTDAALDALGGVDLTYYGTLLSRPVYTHLLTRLDPSYGAISWGAQGNPVWPVLDVMDQYGAIEGGTWNATTVAQLQTMRDGEVSDLNARLDAMSAALEWIAPKLDSMQ